MEQYHKIQTTFLRDPDNNYKTLLEGQYAKPEFEYLADNQWVWTEKVDGTNIRIMWDGNDVSYGGKSDNAQIPSKLVTSLIALFGGRKGLENMEEQFGKEGGVCLYGEGYGANIQKGGGNYREDQSFVLFDVRVGDWWLERDSVEEVAEKFSIDVVPIIGQGTLPEMIELARTRFESRWGNFEAEGLVARPHTYLSNRGGERVITKIKARDFQSQ